MGSGPQDQTPAMRALGKFFYASFYTRRGGLADKRNGWLKGW